MAVSITGLDNVSYTENSSAVIIDSSITFSGTVEYSDGELRFSLSDGVSSDQLALTSASDVNAVGAISVSGGDVFLGNGSGRDRIGSIDTVDDGVNGQDLVINFANPLTNSSFEADAVGSSTVTGWATFEESYTSVLDLSGSSIDYNFISQGETGTGTINLTGIDTSKVIPTFTVEVSDLSSVGVSPTDGSNALRLESRVNVNEQSPPQDIDQPDGNASFHGPYARSETFQAFAGDSITLDWAALGGEDAYEVFGFLVSAGTDNMFGTEDDTRIELFSQRGDTQGFEEASVSIAADGDYQFEFVAGSYDRTGFEGTGAQLFVDNVRLLSATTVNDSVVQAIAQQVTYENTSENPGPSRTLEVSVENTDGETDTATSTISITELNDQPTANGDSDVLSEGGSKSIAVLANDSDPDGDSLTLSVDSGPSNGSAVVDGDNIVYTPNNNFFGSDSFTYEINDGNGETATATVSLTVREAAPLAWLNLESLEAAYWEVTESSILDGQFLTRISGEDWYLGGVGDFDFDGVTDDVLWGNSSSNFQTALWDIQDRNFDTLNDSAFDYAATASFSDPNWRVQAVGDFDNGGNPNDIVYRNIATGENAILSLSGTDASNLTTSESSLAQVGDLAWNAGGVGDLDGDGKFDDIVWHNSNSGRVAIWNMEGDSLIGGQFAELSGSEVTVLGAAGWELSGVSDLDSDGAADDILWRNNSLGQTVYWQMNGNEIEGTGSITPAVGGNWDVVTGAVGEFSVAIT